MESRLLAEYISLLVEQQSATRLTREQMKITCRLIMQADAHVPDTLTRIRALPMVTVVGQKEPVDRTAKGNTVLEVYVKFLPSSAGPYKNLTSIAKLVKRLPGIKIVRVISVEGRPVSYKGQPIVI
jgi:hypothetical protein